MKTDRIILAGIAGGVAFFIMGWLIYGMLLANYMVAHGNPAIMRPMQEMIWWALILSNLVWGFLLSIIFAWSSVNTLLSGARRGAIFGLLLSLAMDFGFYSMYTMYSSLAPVAVDIVASVVMFMIVGAVIGWILGKRFRV